jgi:GNAT superfamily N-acetyltransferase
LPFCCREIQAMAGISSTQHLQSLAQLTRAPLGDLSNGENSLPSRRRRLDDKEGDDADKPMVEVQRFSLVSRGAPPVTRKRARYSNILAPPGLAAHLGDRIQVCRCSECPGAGRQRLCRRDTELHPEYALLLNMVASFEQDCPNRIGSGGSLVTDACVREKSAFFVLGPEKRTVGYVAAVVAANRKVIRQVAEEAASPLKFNAQSPQSQKMIGDGEVDEFPHILQVYVEPEFRRRGYAVAALALLLRGHSTLVADVGGLDCPVLQMLEGLGYTAAGATDSQDGQHSVKFVRTVFGNEE